MWMFRYFGGCLGTIWEHLKKSKRDNCLTIKQLPLLQVPGAGVEPAHPFGHWCLRPTRLPIPPSGHAWQRAVEPLL